MIQARLYDADGSDRAVAMEQLSRAPPGPQQLLWIDLASPSTEELHRVCTDLGLPGGLLERWCSRPPSVLAKGGYLRVDCVPVTSSKGLTFQGSLLSIVAGENRVITTRNQPMAFGPPLSSEADSDIGVLSAESFAASLLNWHLTTYVDAVADFERDVDRLEVEILDERKASCMDELRQLRRAASRLRRMLVSHRAIFNVIARPDFRPSDGAASARHFSDLGARFERAVDLVDHARSLVIGSFELFSSRTALQTNRAMKRLTFVTVVLGILAVLTGLMGMNFEASFFKTTDEGFWMTVLALAGIGGAAVGIGRWQDWI
jgi:magnesium transporter